MNTPRVTPWYCQFWPWFLMFFPATAVVACILTIIIAIQNNPSMVNENYYQEGQNINQRIKQDQYANELSIKANLLFSAETNKINIYLSGNNQQEETLIVAISAPANEQLDRTYTLKRISNNLFSASLQELPKGRFYVALEPENRKWRLLGKIVLPRQETLLLHNQSDDHHPSNE